MSELEDRIKENMDKAEDKFHEWRGRAKQKSKDINSEED